MKLIADKYIKELLKNRDVYKLREKLLSEDKKIRAQAAVALREFNDPNTVDALSKAVEKDDDGKVKIQALISLGEIGDIALEPLIKYSEHPDWSIRMYVAIALGKLLSKEVITVLDKLKNDENIAVRGQATNSLKKVNKFHNITKISKQDEFEKILDYEKDKNYLDIIDKDTFIIKDRRLLSGLFCVTIAFILLFGEIAIYYYESFIGVIFFIFTFSFLIFLIFGIQYLKLGLLKITDNTIIFYRGKKLKFKIDWDKVKKFRTFVGGQGFSGDRSKYIEIYIENREFRVDDTDFSQENIRKIFKKMIEYAKEYDIEVDDGVGLLEN